MFCTNCGKENLEENEFCEFCGAKLDQPASAPAGVEQPTVLIGAVKPAAKPQPGAYSEDATRVSINTAQFEAPPAPAPMAAPAAAAQPAPSANESKLKKNLPKILGFGCGGLLLLGLIVAFIVFVLPNLSLGGGKGLYFYAVQEEGANEAIDAIYSIKGDGTRPKLAAEDRAGFDRFAISNMRYYPDRFISPDGKTLALFTDDEDNELILYSANGDTVKLDDGLYEYGGGFSPNGKYYLAIAWDEDVDTVVYNLKGDEVFTLGDALPAGFVNKDEFIYIEFDGTDYEYGDIGIASIRKQDEERLIKPDEFWGDAAIFNGALYYVDEGVLFKTGFTSKSEPEEVYEFDGDSYGIIPEETAGFIVVYDLEGGFSSAGELVLINKKGESIRISRDARLGDYQISPNGKYIAYIEINKDGENVLFVAGTDGDNEEEIAAGDFLSFAFSPDSKSIVYLEKSYAYEVGTLYVSTLDGEEERVAKDVWDFMAGSRLVYSVLEDGEIDDNPESVIFSVGYNGKGEKTLSDPMDGLISFIAVVR